MIFLLNLLFISPAFSTIICANADHSLTTSTNPLPYNNPLLVGELDPIFAELTNLNPARFSFDSYQGLALVRAPVGVAASAQPPTDFPLEIIGWFRWHLDMQQEFQQDEVTVDWHWTTLYCDGTPNNPFSAAPGDIFLVQLERGERDGRLVYHMAYFFDHRPIASLAPTTQTVLAQYFEGLSDDSRIAKLYPTDENDCNCHDTAMCARADGVGYNGCVCPYAHSWSIVDNVLTCYQPRFYLVPQLEDLIPGSYVVNLRNVRVGDAWARGSNARVSWRGSELVGPLTMQIIAINDRLEPLLEKIERELTAEEVARGAVDMVIPLEFAPGAKHAVVAFASPDALQYGPPGFGKYLVVGRQFELTGIGCIGETRRHGECVAASACTGNEAHRVADGTGSCGSIASSVDNVCCVPRLTPAVDDSVTPAVPAILFPASMPGDGNAYFYAGQKVSFHFVVEAGKEFILYELAMSDDLDTSEPDWIRTAYFADDDGSAKPVRALASYAGVSSLTVVRQIAATATRPALTEYSMPYTVQPFFGLAATAQAVSTTTTTLALEYDVDAHSYAMASFEVVYPLCRGNSFLGLKIGDTLWDTELDSRTENIAGQCMAKSDCDSLSSGTIVDQGDTTFFDVNDECGDDLGGSVVCCRVDEQTSNPGFRAVGNEEESGLSVAAIVAIIAGALCIAIVCVAALCAVGLLTHRRRKPTAVAQHTYAAQPHGGRSRRLSRRVSHPSSFRA